MWVRKSTFRKLLGILRECELAGDVKTKKQALTFIKKYVS